MLQKKRSLIQKQNKKQLDINMIIVCVLYKYLI